MFSAEVHKAIDYLFQSLKGKVLRWSKIRTSKGNVGFVYQSLKGKVLLENQT